MDHFLVDSRHRSPFEVTVPYLCENLDAEIRTLEDFCIYPISKGIYAHDYFTRTAPEDVAATAQCWLYFGLLSFFVCLQDMGIAEAAFVRETATGDKVISSARLPLILRREQLE